MTWNKTPAQMLREIPPSIRKLVLTPNRNTDRVVVELAEWFGVTVGWLIDECTLQEKN